MGRKIIIDTDPGVDDVLAILLALSALPEELEVLLISVTYGNIDVQNCLRNTVALFHHIEKEIEWRKSQGRDPGFAALLNRKPLVAVGPEHPLADQILMADFFRTEISLSVILTKNSYEWALTRARTDGRDGLGGIHESHPHMTPADTWTSLFQQADKSSDPAEHAIAEELVNTNALFIPSREESSKEILRLLRENDPDTITIVAIGPLTNLALAASLDTETFLRTKEVVVMGGAIKEKGNITPVAEFNTFADSIAAARLYALSSPNPASTMPPVAPKPADISFSSSSSPQAQPPPPPPPPPFLSPYPANLSRQLKITLFPLDITNYHLLSRGAFRAATAPLLASSSSSPSPLAQWTSAFLDSTFAKIETLQQNVSGDAVSLQLHDPLTIWYCMSTEGPLSTGTGDTSSASSSPHNDSATAPAPAPATTNHRGWEVLENEDLRVETSGQWTRGMCVVDRRTRRKRATGDDGERPGDTGNWLSLASGNRLRRCLRSPGADEFATLLVQRIFAME